MSTQRNQDPPEVNARVEEGLELVDIIARQLRHQLGTRLELSDLVSYGREGLLNAARGYDASRGVPFRRWANLKIRGAILDGVRQMAELPRSLYKRIRAIDAADRVQETMLEEDAAGPPRDADSADARLTAYLSTMATAMAVGMIVPLEASGADNVDDGAPSPEEHLAREEILAAVRTSIANRPEAERRLLTRHYIDGVTFEQAATEIGLSKSWASRLHTRAIEGIAREMKRSRIG